MSGTGNFGGPNPIGGTPWAPQSGQPTGGYPPVAGSPPGWSPGAHQPPHYSAPSSLQVPGGSGAPQHRRSRRHWIVVIAGVVIAVIVVVAGLVVFTAGGANQTPGDAVRAYLDALARGDAEAVLALALTEPEDTTYLTDEVLEKQLEKTPITDVQIHESTDTGRVRVTANFGDRAVDDNLYLKRSPDSGRWKLEHVAVAVDFRKDSGAGAHLVDTVTLFGTPIPSSGRPLVFPGWVEFGNSNPNLLTVVRNPVFLLGALSRGANVNYGFAVSEAGGEAVKRAIAAALAECAKSRALSPPDCPQQISTPGAIEGTATWTAPTDLDRLDFIGSVDNQGLIDVSGSVEFKVSVESGEPNRTITDVTRGFWLQGTADITKDPPTFTIDKG